MRSTEINVSMRKLPYNSVLMFFLSFFLQSSENEGEEDAGLQNELSGSKFIAHVPVPSQKQIEQALIERKKQELLNRYASEALVKEEESAKELLGINETKNS